jgi:iron complex outermembrane recepter protein
LKRSTLSAAALLAISFGAANAVNAQPSATSARTEPTTESTGTNSLESVIVTGTRGSNRTQFDTLAPVDVLSRDEIRAVDSSDLKDVLAQLVPSFVVQRLPMADGQVFVRPATLRGLSPDQTLVLVNGRRLHRTAMLGSRGSQPSDLSQIPTSAIKRIEVLRDGASAQYGSDAIAGVINIILEDSNATELTVGHSMYSAGDGSATKFNGKTGLDLGETGHIALFGEAGSSDATSRSRQRPDAITFQANHPNLTVPNPVQRWGQPDLKNVKGGFNGRVKLSADVELYGDGLLAHTKGDTDFNWRNPDTNTSIFKTTTVFPGWDLRSIYPAGFSPQYHNELNDFQVVAGLRGDINPRLNWDVSASMGRSKIDYRLSNSINASLGSASPTAFYLGRLTQEEKNLNADFKYEMPVSALSDPVNIGFGSEYRKETYKVKAGDAASYAVGPGAAAGLEANSSGAPGFSASQAGAWGQNSYAAYVDVEVPFSQRLSVGTALRYEDFSEFGNTVNGKLSVRYELSPMVALRGSYSTGFRAPTPGQQNTSSTTQGLDTKTLQVYTSGRLATDDPLAVLLGAKPLKPEKSKTLSMGLAWKSGGGFTGTLDYYKIKLTDRFSSSASMQIPSGVANPMGYTSVTYYTNDFNTTTQGLDLVGSHQSRLGDGRLNLTLAYNYNQTKVDGGGTAVATNAAQRRVFEESLPKQKATVSATYDVNHLGLMARLRHYGAWTDNSGNATGDIFQRFGAIQFLDVAGSYKVNASQTLHVGIDNLLDKYPDEATYQASRGLIYSRNAPYDTDGSKLYVKYDMKF